MNPRAEVSSGTSRPALLLTALRRRVVMRGLLRGVAGALLLGAGVVGSLILVDVALELPARVRRMVRWLPLAAALLPAWLVLRSRARATDARLAMLADERAGTDDVVSTLVTMHPTAADPVADAFRRRAGTTLAALDPRALVPLDASRLWLLCLAVGIVGVPAGLLLNGSVDLYGRWVQPTDAGSVVTSGAGRAEGGATADAPPGLGTIDGLVRPPAYTAEPTRPITPGEPIAALPGATVELRGSGAIPPEAVGAVVIGGGPRTARRSAGGWALDWAIGPDDRGLSLTARAGADTVEHRVLPLRMLRDRPPRVELEAPVRDLVLATPDGSIDVRATALDDYGVAGLDLHWVRSRGGGESFDFEEGTWSWDELSAPGSERTGTRRLVLSALELQPGDVLHVRAVARDANDVTGPGVGVSQTRQIRISDEDDLSDVTTLIGFPIEREREPLLSQRMIILLTEELIEETAGRPLSEWQEEADDVADEQARLRGRVGEQIFSRATGAMQDPEAHLDFEEGEPEVFLDELEAAAEQGPVIDPETGIATIANVEIPAHDHDSDPIVAINRSLLTIYNYMWDAERALRQGLLDPSLVPQNLALDALQALRDSERVFVRGRVAVRPIDVAAARGTGELDGAGPAPRTPGSRSPDRDGLSAEVAGLLARESLVGRAVSLELAGLALDALAVDADPAASARLAEAGERALAGEESGARVAVRAALGFLRASSGRIVAGADGAPTSVIDARFRATARDSVAPVLTAGGDGTARPFVFATVRYGSGDWDSAPLVPTNLIHSLAQYTDFEVAPEGVVVDLASPEIFDHPFLYLTGHLPVFFSEAEGRNLVDFVERGGMIFIDDHNHDIDGAFHRSVTSELGRLFGAGRLQPLPNDHELYSAFFVFEDGPPITGHELSGWGDGLIHRQLQHIEVDGRIGVLYSNKDYSSEWSYHAENKRFLAVDNTRFGTNILVYALTR